MPLQVGIYLAATLLLVIAGCAAQQPEASMPPWTATRSVRNPLITIDSAGVVAEHGYPNVNGPSVIRVPPWIDEPLGRYYMYFAHHRGSFIRLAFADSLEGPWTIAQDSVLRLADVPALDHVASPDVHVDDEQQTVRMYFHSVDDTTRWLQTTYMATSRDGRSFTSGPQGLAPPYLRVFQIGSTWWGLAKVRGGPGGVLLRAEQPEGPFRVGPRVIPDMRHAAVLVEGQTAHIVFSRIGDEPERLLLTSFNPKRRWIQSQETEVHELLRPQFDYEGANLPVVTSEVGEAAEPVHALRDPCVFSEGGERFLFYSVAGESGIAVARLSPGIERITPK